MKLSLVRRFSPADHSNICERFLMQLLRAFSSRSTASPPFRSPSRTDVLNVLSQNELADFAQRPKSPLTTAIRMSTRFLFPRSYDQPLRTCSDEHVRESVFVKLPFFSLSESIRVTFWGKLIGSGSLRVSARATLNFTCEGLSPLRSASILFFGAGTKVAAVDANAGQKREPLGHRDSPAHEVPDGTPGRNGAKASGRWLRWKSTGRPVVNGRNFSTLNIVVAARER